jgi:hypothetical protein
MTSHRQQAPKAAHPCFLTFSVLGATPVFSRPEPAQKVLDVLRTLQQARRLTIYGYALVEDHFYLIAAADEMPKLVAQLKSTTTQQVLEVLASPELQGLLKRLKRFQDPQQADAASQLWQQGDTTQPMLSEEMMRAKLDFIHRNAVQRGYADDPTHYRYCSARDYAGQPGLLPVTTDW